MAGSLILDLLDDQLVCSIHQDMIENPRELPCRHTFCRGCIERITERHNGQARVQCPSCRKHTILPFEGVAALPVPQDIQRLLNTRNGLLRDSNPRRSPEQIREWWAAINCVTNKSECINLCILYTCICSQVQYFTKWWSHQHSTQSSSNLT